MRMIEAPQKQRFSRMVNDLALVLMQDLEIQECCPLALILDDEETRTNREYVSRWIWKTFEAEGLEPRLINRAAYRHKLGRILLNWKQDIPW